MRNKLKYTLIALVSLLFVAALPIEAKKKGGEARIKFFETSYDFGIIDENGGPVSHEFEFINEGDGNLVIKDVRTECGCTRPEYPTKPIGPGKKGKIKITFLPQGRSGSLNKAATIYTNGNPGKMRIRIKGRVSPKM